MPLNTRHFFRKLCRTGQILAGIGVLLSAIPAHAQIALPTATSGALPATTSLNDQQDIYNLGPNAFITRDEGGHLSYTDMILGHLKSRRGVNTDYNVVPLGTTPTPYWIIMAVKNASAGTSRWVLSLGTHAEGRYGAYSRIFIYNHLGGNYLIYGMPDKTGAMPKAESLPLNGGGIPFELAPGHQALLVAYVVPEGGSIVTMTPQIMTEQAFWASQTSLLTASSLLRIMMLAMIGFFACLILLRRNGAYLPFILYLLAQILLFNVQDNNPYSTFPLASELTPLMALLTVICGLILTRTFLGIEGVRNKESTIIFGFIIGAIAIAAVTLATVPDTSPTRAVILLSLPLLGGGLMTLLAVAQSIIGKPAGGLIAAGWLILLIGAIISILSALGVLPSTIALVNTYWMALAVQCVIFVMAAMVRLREEDSDIEDAEEIRVDDVDTISRIRQAKDGSENARLLKVIEHERSILQELRDRELQQNEDMRRARDDADLANRAKSAFLAVISHEIRTPMSGIMGMVRLLLDTTLSKDQRDYAKTIQDSGDAMLALLNDILDFEKIESGKMELEIVDFDLMRLVNDIMTLMSGHANQKKIILRADIDSEVPRYVRGDPVRLRQVLLNLTGNAIKFTSEGSVVLSVKIAAEDGPSRARWNRIYFGVKDSGIGISKEAQKNLFNPFSQADNSISRKYGGSGLGLAICQRLIEAMGDKIAIDSIEEQGSTFFFTVMMEAGQASRVEDSSNTAGAHPQKADTALHILCVDDNDINLKLLKEFVSRMGHQATLAGTGEQAMNLVRAEVFDMILMDVELPGISGMGATRAIRALADRNRAAIPVIALTGNVRDEDIRACYAANMNGHLAKPIEPDKLKAQIDKVLLGKLDNPVTLEEATEQQAIRETRIGEPVAAATASSSSLAFEDEEAAGNGMSSLQAYALRQEPERAQTENSAAPRPVQFTDIELDEDSFAVALKQAPEEPAMEEPAAAGAKETIDLNVFDHTMLDPLKASMKMAELKDMIDSLTGKNDEILIALQSAIAAQDFPVIVARAHEMKGMSGNFGLKELSALAGKIEKTARDHSLSGLPEILALLPDANSRSKAALAEWVGS